MTVDAMTPRKRSGAADRVAGFLRTLHGLQPGAEIASLLPREDARVVAEECLASAERQIVSKLEPEETRCLLRHFDRYLETPANFSFQPVVLHADLSRDHLLAENDEVLAVIDFGDVNWGDRDYDFHYLFLDFGEVFAMEVAQRYGHPDPEHLANKVRYFALADQIGTILGGHGRPLDGQVDAAWRRLRQLVFRHF
jgi:aminoglycoside phosphotransferase (APT) family kinase protein